MKSKRYFYEHGKPYEAKEQIEHAIDTQILRVQHKKPSMIIIDGVMGSGKTTFAIHQADYINSKHNLPPLDLSKDNIQYAIEGADFTTKLRKCYEEGMPVIIYDEAGDFNRKGALTGFNKNLEQIFRTYRAYKIIVILCLPNFVVLSKDLFRDAVPRMLYHCGYRNYHYGKSTCYSLLSMLYILKQMKDQKTVIEQHSYKKGRPSFRTRFLDLEPERSLSLERLSMKGKKDILIKSEIKLQGLLTYEDMAHKLGRSKMTVRLNINKMNIKPAIEIKKQKYFNSEVLFRLQQKMKILKLNN